LSTGRASAQLGTLITSPVLTGRSNDEERCDQAAVHGQLSAMDRNSVVALFLYRSRKRRHNRLLWVHPIIQKREEFGAFYTLFDELRDDAILLRGLSPHANYTDRAAAAGRRS